MLKGLACAGIVVLCVLLAVFVGDSDYHATAIGWIPLIMVVSAIALARVYVGILRRGLELSADTQLHDCQRGSDIALSVRFHNRTPLVFFRIVAHFYVSDLFGGVASQASTTLALSSFETYDLKFSTRFDHIGTYRAGLSHVVIADFLGLFSATIQNDRHQTVHVTPRLQVLETVGLSNESQQEAARAMKTVLADSLDYAYVRPYVPGDPLKTIHWKLSARTEGYMTRLFERTSNPGVAIIMDFYAPENSADVLMGMFDAVVETALSVGQYAQDQGMDTELHYCNRAGERTMRTSWDKNDLEELVADMPAITSDASKSADGVDLLANQVNNQYGQNNLVVCSGNLSSRMVSALIDAKLRRRNPLLFAVVPSDLVGRELEDWCAPLRRLDAAGVGYRVLTCSDELVGGANR